MRGIVYEAYVIDTGYLTPSLVGFLGTRDKVHTFRQFRERIDYIYHGILSTSKDICLLL